MNETNIILESVARRLHAVTKRITEHETTMNALATAIRDLQQAHNNHPPVETKPDNPT